MAINAGSVFVNLGAKVDRSEFAAYDRELQKVRAKAAEKERYKAQLGADFDSRAFNSYQRELNKAERQTRDFDKSNQQANKGVEALGKTMRTVFKDAGIITGIGVAAQGVSALGAAGVAATASLGPLAGALGAYPALGSAAAQGMGVFQLAIAGVGDALEAGIQAKTDKSADSLKKYQEALKGVAPAARGFVGTLIDNADKLGTLRTEAGGLFAGANTGFGAALKNFPVLQKIVHNTALAFGDLAEKAGKLVGSGGFGRDLATQGERNVKWISQLGGAAIPVANGLRNITLAAGDLTQHMVDLAVKGANAFERFTATNRRNGNLQAFFRETADVMDRVLRIVGNLGVGLINIFKGAYPLGRDFQVSLEKTSETFRKWTESAHGQNVIAKYFADARGPSYELFKLIRDVGKVFFSLGTGNQVQPLIRQVRTQLLPAFATLVDSTTKAFGPVFFDAVTQALILFSKIAGTSGPLVAFTKLLDTILTGINEIIDRIPAIGTALSAVIAVGGIYKAFGIAASLTGVGKLITLLKTARGIAVTSAVVEGAGGAAGAARGAGALGKVGGAAGAGSALGPLGTLAAGGAAFVGLNILQDKAKAAGKALQTAQEYAGKLLKGTDAGAMRKFADSLQSFADKGGAAGDAFKTLQDRLRGNAKHLEDWRDKVKRVNSDVGRSFKTMKTVTEGNLGDIRRFTAANTRDIKRRLGDDTEEGRKALSRNFRLAAQAVRDRMAETGKTTKAGTEEIQRLMTKALSSLGLTKTQAANIVDHGTLQSTSERVPGGGGGRRAGGGWIGQRGMSGGDTVPAMLGAGEAVLNRHQQGVIEALLGDGFLDMLFAKVNRPHYLASGGIAGAVGAANQFEKAAFPYRWGGGHERSPTPFEPVDCSGAVSYVLQHAGVNIPTMVSGQLASAGKPGAGALTVFANPVHTFMRIGSRYFGTSGSNPGGGAGWFDDPGEAYKSRFAVRHFDAGDGLGATIRPPRIGGDGAISALANRALSAVAGGANFAIEQAVASMGLGTGDPGDPGPVAKGSYNKSQLARLWTGAGGPRNVASLMAAIALAESNGNPRAHNPSGATGLWQILGNPFPGDAYNPATNARMAVSKYHSQGLGAWEAYTNGAYRQYMARGGRVINAARGFYSGIGTTAGAFAGQAIGRMAGRASSYNPRKPSVADILKLKLARGYGVDVYDGQWDIFSPAADFGRGVTAAGDRLDLAAAQATLTPSLEDDLGVAKWKEHLWSQVYFGRIARHAPLSKVKAALDMYTAARSDVAGAQSAISEQWAAIHDAFVGDGSAVDPTSAADPSADLQALLDQANSRLAGVQGNLAAAQRVQQAFSSSGDIGFGGFGNAYQAARMAPRIVINTLHPGDPQTLVAIGNAATAGQSLQSYVPSTRSKVGV